MYEHGNRIITCKNLKDGISIDFTERGFDPFLLVSASGIYDTDNKIYKSDNVVVDGAEFLGSVMSPKNIVLVLKDIDDYEHNREIIDRVFSANNIGTLTVRDGDHERAIEYYVENVSSTATTISRYTTVSLICPDPHFYDPYTNHVRITMLMDNFSLPHEFRTSGEEFSYYNFSYIGRIINENAEEYTGMTIILETYGVVENPSLTKIQTQETIKIGNTHHTLSMERGDIVTITTQTANKNVTFTHNGVTQDINHYLTSDSAFFQLTRGINTIGYTADSGKDNMLITILYKNRYMRA
jgi:hypothetical protein